MTQILADAKMAKQIAEAEGQINIVDETGTVIAVCLPVLTPHASYTREDVEAAVQEARQNPGSGKSLAEVLARLKRPAGEQP